MSREVLDKHHHQGFTSPARLSSQYPAKTFTDIDYEGDLAITADITTFATVLQHLGNVVTSVGLCVNASKTEFICFNHQYSIQTLLGELIKLSESFT